jgi:outer membrane protein assembly factor BamD (BamD/ComL family)
MFFQGRFAEATEMYRSFANQHRGDPNLPYARFRVAHSYFKRLPTSWFLAPPAYEMDQTLTQQAEAELTGFISLFPTSEYAPEARRMLKATRRMLFEHELYAADFYRSRGAWRGVAWRLRDAFERFPEFVANDEKLAWRYVDAAERGGHALDALRALGWFVEKYPSSPRRDEALARAAAVQAKLEAERPVDSEPDPTEKLDEVPDFRLKLPGSDSPDGDEGTEETEDEGLDDSDEEVEPSDDDSEAPQRLRPPELPPLEP